MNRYKGSLDIFKGFHFVERLLSFAFQTDKRTEEVDHTESHRKQAVHLNYTFSYFFYFTTRARMM